MNPDQITTRGTIADLRKAAKTPAKRTAAAAKRVVTMARPKPGKKR